jgi:nucleotide-binding universal stress UspA family protein
MIKKILAAIDGSEHAWKALDLATDMAQQHSAQLIVLHVVRFEPLPVDRRATFSGGAAQAPGTLGKALPAFAEGERIPVEEEEGRYRYARSLGDQLTRSAEARVRDKGMSAVVGRTVDGKPAEQILEVAGSEGVDMIVMGSRGLSDAKALFLGSVSHKVANQATCTCVTVK